MECSWAQEWHHQVSSWDEEPLLETSPQRQHERIALSESVQYYLDRKLHSSQLVDISEGGLRLGGGDPLPLLSEIKLFVHFPTGCGGRSRMCVFDGRVVWRGFSGVGIQFVDPPNESLRELRTLIRSTTPIDRPRGLGAAS
jgi:hypothetical protein